MKTRERLRVATVFIATLTTHQAWATVNDKCNDPNNPCVNASQTGTNSAPALESDCNGANYCLGAQQNGSGEAAEFSSGGNAVTLFSINDGTGTAIGGWSIGGNGITGQTSSSGEAGVFGINLSTGSAGSGSAGSGVYGSTSVSGASGVFGLAGSGVFANGVGGSASNSGTSGVWGSNTSGGYGVYGTNGNSNASGWAGYFWGRVNMSQTLWFSGTCYYPSGSCSSDIRLKKNVQPLAGALDDLAKLRAVTFEWREPGEHGPAGTQVGFIAQEVEKVKPEWVSVDDQGFKAVNLKGLDVMLVASVGTLKKDNDVLRAQAMDLQDRIKALEAARRPMLSGIDGGGLGLGLVALAGAVIVTRRKRSEEAS